MTTSRAENEEGREGGGPCGMQMRAISELVWRRETAGSEKVQGGGGGGDLG